MFGSEFIRKSVFSLTFLEDADMDVGLHGSAKQRGVDQTLYLHSGITDLYLTWQSDIFFFFSPFNAVSLKETRYTGSKHILIRYPLGGGLGL